MGMNFETPGLGGVMSYLEGQQTQKDMENQAQSLEYQAQYAQQLADVETQDFMEVVNQVVGQAQAATGASGFDASSESAQSAVDAIVRRGEIDAEYIQFKGDVEAWALREDAGQMRTAAHNLQSLNRVAAGQQAFFNAPDRTSPGNTSSYNTSQRYNTYGDFAGWGDYGNDSVWGTSMTSGPGDTSWYDRSGWSTNVSTGGGTYVDSYEGMVFY